MYITRSEVAGSYSNLMFNFLRNYHTVFHSGYTILYPPQEVHKCFSFSTSSPALIFCFFIVAILMGMRWYLIVILICISLMISHIEHLFMCLLAIYIYCLETCLFKSFAHFRIECSVFLLSSYRHT